MINIAQNDNKPLMSNFYILIKGKYPTELTGIYDTTYYDQTTRSLKIKVQPYLISENSNSDWMTITPVKAFYRTGALETFQNMFNEKFKPKSYSHSIYIPLNSMRLRFNVDFDHYVANYYYYMNILYYRKFYIEYNVTFTESLPDKNSLTSKEMKKIFNNEDKYGAIVTRVDDYATIYLSYKIGNFSSEKTLHSMWETITKQSPLTKPAENELLVSPTYSPPYLCNLVKKHLVDYNLAGFILTDFVFIPRQAKFNYSFSLYMTQYTYYDNKQFLYASVDFSYDKEITTDIKDMSYIMIDGNGDLLAVFEDFASKNKDNYETTPITVKKFKLWVKDGDGNITGVKHELIIIEKWFPVFSVSSKYDALKDEIYYENYVLEGCYLLYIDENDQISVFQFPFSIYISSEENSGHFYRGNDKAQLKYYFPIGSVKNDKLNKIYNTLTEKPNYKGSISVTITN